MKKYQKKIILFPAGASGHFLASFLTTGAVFVRPQYRVDLGQLVSSAIFIPSDLEKIKNSIINDPHETILSHYNNVSDLCEFKNQHWIRKIYPHTNMFGWLKNVFYKKQQIERVNFSQADMMVQFDAMFENMKDFYFKIKADADCPEHLTLDFGKITDLNYLTELYIDANGIAPTNGKIDLARAYIDLQHTSIDDYNYLNMEEIANAISPRDLYDIAILLFMYEKNHNTIDQNRLWSIDNLPTDIDHAVEFLIKNSKNYSIF
jgi:hypothetical protein